VRDVLLLDADVVHANLTVYENLLYNAVLRLPRTHTKETKVKLVVEAMHAIGITHIKDSLVGDASRRGISGGQKKRVNIGMELVAMPAVVFMDEPYAPARVHSLAQRIARAPSLPMLTSCDTPTQDLGPRRCCHCSAGAVPLALE
jgi:ABC-type lipopolysaccharide export system ATPase subunit